MKRFLLSVLAMLVFAGSTFVMADATEKEAKKPVQKKQAPAKASKLEAKSETAAVEVVFVLDTTGSMGGLLNAAKQKIWAIANTLATAKPAPEIKMGLVGYRDRGDQYVTKITQLSDDLDAVYKDLMGYNAQGGGDGPESVNQALHEAITKINWSKDKTTYRVIFLVGDAPPHMDYLDEVQYPKSCELAVKTDIIVNTIQCGNNSAAAGFWTKIAQLAEGKYFRVEQSGGAVLAATPFDAELAKLSTQLGGTRVYFGAAKERKLAKDKSKAAEATAAKAPTPTRARRAEFFSKKAGLKTFAGKSELVDAVSRGKVDLDKLADDELPENLRKLSKKDRKKHVQKLFADRLKIQKKIVELGKKRQAYIRNELAKQAKQTGKKKGSLDLAIFESIKKQAAPKGLKYEGGPEY